MEHTPYASAYIIEQDGKTAGYALLARSFSQEAGGMVTWIEELYIRPEFQGHGLGTAFFQFLEAQNDGTVKRYRLEYERCGTVPQIGLYDPGLRANDKGYIKAHPPDQGKIRGMQVLGGK